MFKSKVKPPNWGYITVLTTPPLFLVCAVPMFNSIQGSTQCLLQPWMFHEPLESFLIHLHPTFIPFSHFFQFFSHFPIFSNFYAIFMPCFCHVLPLCGPCRFSGRGAPLRQSGAAESHRAPEPGGPCRLRAAKAYRRRADAWDGMGWFGRHQR